MTKEAKKAMRAAVLLARSGLSTPEQQTAASLLSENLLGLAVLRGAGRVAAYWPFGSEPSPVGAIEALRERGVSVLLPVGLADGDLDWASYTGPDDLGAGAWRFAEPTAPRLGAAAIAAGDAVLVPALAVDTRGGRLGRGSGAYDRSLARVHAGVPILAIVYDEVLVAHVPTESHDRPVTHIITPVRVLDVAAFRHRRAAGGD